VAVQKFRTFEEARRALWLAPGDPRIFERMQRLAELARSHLRPRGISRYRTFAEALSEERQGWKSGRI